jgi:hypothetical protein
LQAPTSFNGGGFDPLAFRFLLTLMCFMAEVLGPLNAKAYMKAPLAFKIFSNTYVFQWRM